MLLAYTIYLFLLVLLYTASAHNNKLLFRFGLNPGPIEPNRSFWRWPLFFGFTILVLIVGFRYNVGVDYMGYYNNYYGVGLAHHVEVKIAKYEFGYEFITRALQYLNFRAWAFFTISAVLIWYFFIQSFKPFPHLLKWGFFFAFTTGFFFASMNGLRQSIALAIFMYAIKFIEKGSLKKYTLYIFAALAFHTSILLVYPFYFFIKKISFTGRKWLMLYVLTYVVGTKIDIRGIIIAGLGLFPKYQHYTERFLEDFSNPTPWGFGNIYFFAIGFAIILLSKDLLKKAPWMGVYYNLFFIGSILFNFLWRYSILGRVTYLFIWFKIFCLASLVHYFGKSKYSWLVYLILVGEIIMFFYKIYKGENLCSPFQFLGFA